jgi:hypothetical protein
MSLKYIGARMWGFTHSRRRQAAASLGGWGYSILIIWVAGSAPESGWTWWRGEELPPLTCLLDNNESRCVSLPFSSLQEAYSNGFPHFNHRYEISKLCYIHGWVAPPSAHLRNEPFLFTHSEHVHCRTSIKLANQLICIKGPFSCYYQRRRYSDWLRTERPRVRSSSPDRIKNFLFSTSSRPALESNKPPIQWVPVALSTGVKRQGLETDHSPSASQENMDLYIHSPIRLHGVVLN